MINGEGLVDSLKNMKGAIAALIAAAMIGGTFMTWQVKKRLDALERRTVWIICSTVPPHRSDVLAALEVECRFDPPTRQRRTINGVPLLDEEDRQ